MEVSGPGGQNTRYTDGDGYDKGRDSDHSERLGRREVSGFFASFFPEISYHTLYLGNICIALPMSQYRVR